MIIKCKINQKLLVFKREREGERKTPYFGNK